MRSKQKTKLIKELSQRMRNDTTTFATLWQPHNYAHFPFGMKMNTSRCIEFNTRPKAS